jgi:hypothetical protein
VPTFSSIIQQFGFGTDCSGTSLWLATASTPSGNTIAYSYTPATASSWNGLGNTILTYTNTVEYGTDCFGKSLWIAGGLNGNQTTGNALAYSYTPTVKSSWVGLNRTNTKMTDGCKNLCYGLDLFGNPIWMATGTSSYNGLFYSKNPTVDLCWNLVNITTMSTANTVTQEKIPKYIAGGNGVDNMRGSVDGQTWYYIKSPFSTATNDVCWSQQQQLWVAVGEGGNTVAFSSNGIQWTGRSSVFTFYGKKVSFSPSDNLWYATGYNLYGGMSTATSTDGNVWTITSTSTNSFLPITVNNLSLLGTGADRLLATSATFTIGNTTNTINAVSANTSTSTLYAASTGVLTMSTSTDGGTTWTPVSTPFSAVNDVAIAGSSVVAAGVGTNAVAVYDGTAWTGASTGLTTGTNLFYDAATTRMYAMGGNTLTYATNLTGTWTGMSIPNMTTINTYGTNGTIMLVGGIGTNNLQSSTNGTTWQAVTSPFSTATNDVFWSQQQNRWIAVGEGGNTLAYSDNGTTWTGTGTIVFGTRGRKVIFNVSDTKWYAVGDGTFTAVMSTDGQFWSPTSNPSLVLNSLSKMVVVGYENTDAVGAYSPNYYTQTPYFANSTSSFSSISYSGGTGIAYGLGVFVACGKAASSTTTSIAYSTDAVTWTKVTNSGSLSTSFFRVTFGNGVFIAASSNGLYRATSITGLNGDWKKVYTINSRAISYISGSTWMAGRGNISGLVSVSTDNGINWSSLGIISGFTQVRDIAFGNGVYVACGFITSATNTGSKIARSTDGASWSVVNNTGMHFGNVVKYNNGVWLCGGVYAVAGGTILFKSVDNGQTWTSVLVNTAGKMTSVNGIYSDGTRWYISGAGAANYMFAVSLDNSPSTINDFTFVSGVTMTGDIAVRA